MSVAIAKGGAAAKKKAVEMVEEIADTSPKGSGAAFAVLKALKKQHGDEVGSLGGTYAPVDRLPTGIFPLDLAIGGGLPLNRTSMLFGPESSGKTAVGLRTIAMCQRYMKKRAVLIDREDVYDKKWTQLFGVNTDDLIVIKPSNGEQVVDATEGMLNADDVGIVLLDSLATMQPQKWIQAEAGTAHVGGNTQLISDLYTKSGAALTKRGWAKNPVLFVVINQIRNKIGVMFGDPETTPGGHQPRFASSMTIRFYGKKVVEEAVSKHMPAYLQVNGIVRKWRVPIISTSFKYEMALVPQGEIHVGDVLDTWKTVGTYLQNLNKLVKSGKQWECLGVKETTLEQMKERYMMDKDFQLDCQREVLLNADQIEAQK